VGHNDSAREIVIRMSDWLTATVCESRSEHLRRKCVRLFEPDQ